MNVLNDCSARVAPTEKTSPKELTNTEPCNDDYLFVVITNEKEIRILVPQGYFRP